MNKETMKILKRNKKIYEITIKECKKKTPMYKMTYPEVITTDKDNHILYSDTIKLCNHVVNIINKLIKKKEVKNEK